MQDLTKIAQFICSAHPSAKIDQESILASQDLFADGWLDSLLHLKLLSFLESEFQVRIPPFQITRKSFLNVKAMATLVTQIRNG